MRNNNGQFTKGNTAGGRTQGSKNKVTQKIRENFLYFIENNIEGMQADFEQLDPKDRFKILLDMARFIVPTLKAVEFGNILDELSEDDFKILINKLKSDHL